MLAVVNEDGTTPSGSSLLNEIVREGARRMPAAVLEAEANARITELADERDTKGRRLVVRDGHHQPRQADHTAFMDRDLAEVDYAHVGADGIRLNVRPEEAKACVLVLIGVRADGSKELVALEDGYRESGESWAELLRDCARRGMRAPARAVGDGALGFRKALAEVFPTTREQRRWVHKTADVLDSLPKSAPPGAKKAVQDIYSAEDIRHAEAVIKTFAELYGAKGSKAVKRITDDRAGLPAFHAFPAEHRIHLRTTNPIESTFATVRPRTKATRGAGSRTAALAMVFKLVESAQQRWRAVNAPHLVALVHPGHRASAAVATATGLTPPDERHDGEIRWHRSIKR
ncbi:IS256 family transposase [Streptomyces sp. NPDC044984]|uniref:IS256 family transposase n=1 Tax=Streptomyces sp. NPDC044984 TaxID=3154335 RepID=UPI0034033751